MPPIPRELNRREFLQLGCVWTTAVSILGVWILGPDIVKSLLNNDYERIKKQMGNEYGLKATADAQDAQMQEEMAGELFRASGVVTFDGSAAGCSASFIDKDTQNKITYLLTANHCLEAGFETLTIQQPQLAGAEVMTVNKQDVRTISHPDGKDLAIIAVRDSRVAGSLNTLGYKTGDKSLFDSELCGLMFPALEGKDKPNDYLALRAKFERDFWGQPIQKNGHFMVDKSAWAGASGSGLSLCQGDQVVAVLVAQNLNEDGKGWVELLDDKVDGMIKSAGQMFK